jgi:guanylate kinase
MEDTLPKLHNKKAFQEALENYHVSDHAKRVLASTPFVALSSLAGGGRNTVIRKLADNYNYIFAISDTTRPPKVRDGKLEQDGINYYFRSEAEILKDIQNGEYIEAEIIHNQQVSGTSIREIERTAKTGKIPIHDFEYGGMLNVYKAKPDAALIGLIPPSYDEWIRRLRGREVMTEQEFFNRLTTADKVLENLLTHPQYTLVVNDTIEQCAEDIHLVVEKGDYSSQKKSRACSIAETLHAQVKKELERRTLLD